MKTIKVKNCEGCPFCVYDSESREECQHPDLRYKRIAFPDSILVNCPLKNEPIKIELK